MLDASHLNTSLNCCKALTRAKASWDITELSRCPFLGLCSWKCEFFIVLGIPAGDRHCKASSSEFILQIIVLKRKFCPDPHGGGVRAALLQPGCIVSKALLCLSHHPSCPHL